ncbi:cell division protein FtsQ/DivIB [Castellaniella sp.]|uniref:cell division protein FtsQ/DivIB n=1 Tax=Castellaniella sp. TaxID=1955812 RepID=UPI0035651110
MLLEARLVNLLANLLALAAVLSMVAGVVFWIIRRPYFEIRRLEITPMADMALDYVTPANLQTSLDGRVRGNFFLLDLNTVRSTIESAPWIRHVDVRRIWPDTLRVSIEEQRPLAFWNENQMINTWGETFTANPGELPDGLNIPQLNGPAHSERLVVQRYAEIAGRFAPLGLSVQEATLTPRYAWEVVLSDGMQLSLGRDPAADVPDPHGRAGALPFAARIDRFVRAWPELTRRLGQVIRHADLRHPNGFAISLASGSVEPSSSNTP